MAIYHCNLKAIARSTGRSSVAAASYRAAEKLHDPRLGVTYDFTRKRGVETAFIVSPPGAPDWVSDRQQLWSAVELAHKRGDAVTAREVEVSLPCELSDEQAIDLARTFASDLTRRYGVAADVAIHRQRDQALHAHILLTTKAVGPDGLGNKVIQLDPIEAKFKRLVDPAEAIRANWEQHANAALAAVGRPERIDRRTLEAQRGEALKQGDFERAAALDREPEPKIGAAARRLERKGQPTDRGDEWRAVRRRNQVRAQTRAQRMKEWRMKKMAEQQRQHEQQKPRPQAEQRRPVPAKAAAPGVVAPKLKQKPWKKEHWLTKLQREATQALGEMMEQVADDLIELFKKPAPAQPVKARTPVNRNQKTKRRQPVPVHDLNSELRKSEQRLKSNLQFHHEPGLPPRIVRPGQPTGATHQPRSEHRPEQPQQQGDADFAARLEQYRSAFSQPAAAPPPAQQQRAPALKKREDDLPTPGGF